jgi:ribosomal protein S18 acetylase RimI-like enzyme
MRLSYAGRFGGAPEVRWQDWWGNVSTDSEFDPGLCIVAVDTAGAPAGFVLCWTSSFIKDLVVRPDWQRRGLGAALLRETFCRLALRGSRSVALKVDGANHVARALYVKMGFRG